MKIDGDIFLEPLSKNTAPSIFASALIAQKRCAEAVLIVLPSDHSITDQHAFMRCISEGIEALENTDIVVFGVEPNRPETGYGYIEVTTKKIKGSLEVEGSMKSRAQHLHSSTSLLATIFGMQVSFYLKRLN